MHSPLRYCCISIGVCGNSHNFFKSIIWLLCRTTEPWAKCGRTCVNTHVCRQLRCSVRILSVGLLSRSQPQLHSVAVIRSSQGQVEHYYKTSLIIHIRWRHGGEFSAMPQTTNAGACSFFCEMRTHAQTWRALSWQFSVLSSEEITH